MGKDTDIGWAHVPGYSHGGTWNPWQGCTKISQGCKNCYMFREKKFYGQDPSVVVKSKANTFDLPLHTHEPTPFFTCSWSDFFHPAADAWREYAWSIIKQKTDHLFLILTKRPELMAERLPADWGEGYSNVWLGVTAEDQATANERLPILCETPAKLRFVSCEPLLSPINFHAYLYGRYPPSWSHKSEIDWVIVGGESGPGYRQMDEDWAWDLRQQCQEAEVPFYFKQMGGTRKIEGAWGGPYLGNQIFHEFPKLP